jgi:hypothetical protein
MLPTTARGENVTALSDFPEFFLAFSLFPFFISIFDCLCLSISKPLVPDVITCYSIILHDYISSWKTLKKRKVKEKIKDTESGKEEV